MAKDQDREARKARIRQYQAEKDRIIRDFSKGRSDVFFIQIGSHDGVSNDHLNRYILEFGWSGILVEPVRYLFDKLRANYAGRDGLIFENVAVSDEAGEKPFYRLRRDEQGVPGWYDQLGSFDKQVVLKHTADIPDIAERIVEDRVECVTYAELAERNGVERVDILQIDTEGHDYRIIRSLPLENGSLRPEIIIYENRHLSDADKAACKALLAGHGYAVKDLGADTIAY